jgi:PqqD family protein of HPr-rel-A system
VLENLALSESGFLFDARTGATYTLSATGTFLLRRLIGGDAALSLPEALSERYEVDPQTAGRDVEQFLFRLRDLGLVTESVEQGR